MPLSLATGPTPPVTPPDATSCSTWDFYFNPGSWQACVQAAGNAQLQNVVANAQYYYGPNSVTAQTAAQQAAIQQEQTAADALNIANYYGSGNLNPFFTPGGIDPNDTSTWPWWLWLLIVGGSGFALIAVLK